MELVVERKYTLLTEADYLRMFGCKHRSKDPRVPRMYLPGLDGKPELHFVFKPKDDFSHKTLRMLTSLGESKEEQ
eukprot:3511668-Amphidinium_carterae.1